MKKKIKTFLKKLPQVKELIRESAVEAVQKAAEETALKAAQKPAREDPHKLFVPPGHFYSPIPSMDEVRENEARIFKNPKPKTLPAIALNVEDQLKLIGTFRNYYGALPFTPLRSPGRRYYYENSNYSYTDAIFLHCMIRHVKPKKIIEVGSGFSSCVTLDTNELFFDNGIQCSFIEPYPELLKTLITDSDRGSIEIIPEKLQDVELSRFMSLSAGDILFIDSTHVSKTNSDVNYILFEILPALKNGVYIHFHDIFYPFEYPREWILENRAWNEDYILRAFLQYNGVFKIILFSDFLAAFHRDALERNLPLCIKNTGGNLWLRKTE